MKYRVLVPCNGYSEYFVEAENEKAAIALVADSEVDLLPWSLPENPDTRLWFVEKE
jgi:hypothetical protein